jgi:phosphatidylinositol 3-kinase
MPFFDAYGKLQTGMTKLPLEKPTARKKSKGQNEIAINPGLAQPPKRSDPSPWQQDDTDPAWKASRILEQLDRFEGINKGNTSLTSATTGGATAGVPPSSHPNPMTGKAFGDIPSVPWLDKVAKEYCEKTIREAEEKSGQNFGLYSPDNAVDSPSAFLVVELPVFEVPVMHEETFYPTPQQGPSGSVTPLDLALYRQKKAKNGITNESLPKSTNLAQPPPFHPLEMIPFLDYEDENDSPIDDKYRTLAHDLLRGLVDPALKPDRVQRDKLAAIIASPSHHPSREEKDLLWRFRFSLVDNRRALTKFLLAVDWTVESEVVQAAELLEQWRKRSPIEVTDALKLLGKQVAYQTNLVRAYAIDTLASAPDEELNLYLLQLVQALKFDQETGVNHQAGSLSTSMKSSLATFLIGRAARNVQLANYLYWYLKVELQDPAHGARYREIFAELQQTLSQTPFPSGRGSKLQTSTHTAHDRQPQRREIASGTDKSRSHHDSKDSHGITPFNKIVESVSKFGDKLMGTEGSSAEAGEASTHQASSRNNRSVWDVLSDQDLFISGIMDVQMSYATKGKQAAKEAHLRSTLAKEGYDKAKNSFPLPCAPEVMVNGVDPQKAKVFRSAVYPALIEFHVDYIAKKNDFGESPIASKAGFSRASSSKASSSESSKTLHSYRVMMKTGDDLRQDQLAMMMIKLMDGLLKRASLDLFLTPYSIIATSPSSGMIEFVEESSPVSQILANNNNSIMQFLQSTAPQQGAKYGIRPDVLSTYVRSVAGESSHGHYVFLYFFTFLTILNTCTGGCVITYLLGVGDRHLDNLMITRRGHFFHIDFGFMFGRDPKPLPPAFRLTREMVEGMGGMDSTEYRQFCSLACQAFNALRKSAGLVLNLLHLMSDAGIEDLSNNPSADAEGVIAKVEERFRLDLTDEQAERFFLNLINESLAAIAPRLMDVFHSIAVARR